MLALKEVVMVIGEVTFQDASIPSILRDEILSNARVIQNVPSLADT